MLVISMLPPNCDAVCKGHPSTTPYLLWQNYGTFRRPPTIQHTPQGYLIMYIRVANNWQLWVFAFSGTGEPV